MDKIVDRLSRRERIIYLAGVFDSDGSSFISRTKANTSRTGFGYRAALKVAMVDSGPVKLFQETFGGLVGIRKPKHLWKLQYRWEINGQLAAEVAAQLLPFSHNERKKAALQYVIDFSSTLLQHFYRRDGVPLETQQRRELLYKCCCAINARGPTANNQSPADLAVIASLKVDTAQLSFLD